MQTNGNDDKYLFSKRYTRYIFTLLFLLYMFDYLDRMVIASLLSYIKVEWSLTDSELGLLNMAVLWTIVALTFPVSLLVDRWSRTRTIGAMAFLWGLATAAGALVKTFPQLVLARVFIGVGEAGYAPGGSAMISGLYPERRRSWIMGIWNAGIPLGSALGVTLGGFIAAHWGWRHALGLVAIPGLVIAVLFFFVKDYKTVKLEKHKEPETKTSKESSKPVRLTMREMVQEFTRKPSLIFTYIGITFVVFVTSSVMWWLPEFYKRIEGIDPAKASTKAGIVMLLAIIGAPLGGFIADRWRRRKLNARLVFPGLSTLVATLLLFLSFTIFSGNIQYYCLLLMGISITAFIPAAGAVTQDLVHPGLRATSYAIAVMIQNSLGAGLGPWVVGKISDKYNLLTALSVLPVFLLIASILFLVGSLYYKRDIAKVEKVELEVAP
jgi:MFS family permease